MPAKRREPPVRHAATVRIRVKGGYEPALVHGWVGEPLRLVFTREETAACSERVVFPEFGRSATLPPFEEVAIELVPDHEGEYEFTCQAGVLHGRLLVRGAGGRDGSRAPARRLPGDTVRLALLAWPCTLAFLLLVAVPILGWRTGALLSLIWLGVLAGVRFVVCTLRRATPDAHMKTAT